MTDTFKLVTDTLLVPAGLETSDIDRLMGRLVSQDIDYADLYFQYSRQEGWMLEDGAVKSGSRSTDQGVGLRAVSGEKTGFAYSDEFVLPALAQAADAARAIAKSGGTTSPVQWRNAKSPSLYTPADPLSSLSDQEKVELLQAVEVQARACDPRVSQVMASLAAVHDGALVARSDGQMTAAIRPLVRLNVAGMV